MSDAFFTPLVDGIFGKAVAEGMPEPSDPIAPTQNDGDGGEGERSGRWPDPLPASTDPARDPLNYPPTGPQVENTPTPIIGTVPFGGVVIAAGEIVGPVSTDPADLVVTVGDNGNARPGVLGLYLVPAANIVAAVPRILTDGDGFGSLSRGAPLFTSVQLPVYLPLRRATILMPRSSDSNPAQLGWFVIASNIGQSV